MRYYLNCENLEDFQQALSALSYCGFKLTTKAKFNKKSLYNVFVAESYTKEAVFTNSNEDKNIENKNFTELNIFENIFMRSEYTL